MENLLRLRILVAASYLLLSWYLYLVCRSLLRVCKQRNLIDLVRAKAFSLRQMFFRTRCSSGSDDLFEATVRKILKERRLDRAFKIRLIFMHLLAPIILWDSVNCTRDGIWGDISFERVNFYFRIKQFPAFIMVLSSCVAIVAIPCLNNVRTLDVIYVLQGLRILGTVLSTKDTLSFVFTFPWLTFTRVLLSWACGNVVVTTAVNMAICVVHCWAYSRAASAGSDADAKLFPGHVSVYIARDITVTLMTSAFCWMVEHISDAEVRATLDSKSSVKLATTVQGILSVLCDVVVHLGEDFCISRPNPHLATFLLSGRSGEAFRGCSFPDLMVGPDGARFREHVARGHHESHAQALNVVFKGSSNTAVNARIYHSSYENIAGKMQYIVGISEAGTLADLAAEQEVLSHHFPMELKTLVSRTHNIHVDGVESLSSMTSSDIANILPNVGCIPPNGSGLHTFQVTCDAISQELTILDGDLNFCILCGLHPAGRGLLDWFEQPRQQAVLSWIQSHVNARECKSECSEPTDLDVVLQTPLAEELNLQFHAHCALSFPEEFPQMSPAVQSEDSEDSGEDMPMLCVQLLFSRVRQRCRSGAPRKYSTTIAVSCDVLDSNLPIHRCTLGFSLLCGCHPEDSSFLPWIKDPQGFFAWLRANLSTASKDMERSGFEMILQPPLAKQMSFEFSTLCSLHLDEDSDSDRSDTRAHLFVRLVFSNVQCHAGSKPDSDMVHSEPREQLEAETSLRFRSNRAAACPKA